MLQIEKHLGSSRGEAEIVEDGENTELRVRGLVGRNWARSAEPPSESQLLNCSLRGLGLSKAGRRPKDLHSGGWLCTPPPPPPPLPR